MDDFPDNNRVCAECGKPLKSDVRFCSACGKPCAENTKNADSTENTEIAGKAESVKNEKCDSGLLIENDDTERQMLSEHEETPPAGYCSICGAPIYSNASFCRKCGATVMHVSAQGGEEFGQIETEGKPLDTLGKRCIKISVILMIVAYAVEMAGFFCEFTPFLAVSGAPPCGIQLIGAMFGGQSGYAAMGIRYEYLRLAGWAYFAYMLISVLQTACLALALTSKKRKNPALLLPMSVTGLVSCIILWVVAAKAQADLLRPNKSLFMSAPCMFVFAFLSLGIMIAATVLYGVFASSRRI